ncbi:MAG: hypothetical protein Q4B15_06045, partial [Lachnospiraceae bacterium]|nr:hypothetical protein [Lachnospiraceae bacterium]
MSDLKWYLNTSAEQKARRIQEEKRAAERRAMEEQARRYQEVTAEAQRRAAARKAAEEQARRYQETTAEAQRRAAERKAAEEQARRYQETTAEAQRRAAERKAAEEQARRYQDVTAEAQKKRKRRLNSFGVKWTAYISISFFLGILQNILMVGEMNPMHTIMFLFLAAYVLFRYRCIARVGAVIEALLIPFVITIPFDFFRVKFPDNNGTIFILAI